MILAEIRQRYQVSSKCFGSPDHGYCSCCQDVPDLLELVDTEQTRVRSLNADLERWQHNFKIAQNRVRELEGTHCIGCWCTKVKKA